MAMVERLTIIRGVEKFELQTKTARWVLAKEEGYSPVQMLVSAIGACGGYVYQSVLENSHIPFEFEKIEVTYSREVERRAQPLKQVTILFYVCSRSLSRTGDTVFETCLPKLSSDSIIG